MIMSSILVFNLCTPHSGLIMCCAYVVASVLLRKGDFVAQFIRKITKEVAGQDLNDISNVSKNNHAALSVAIELCISENEACDM